MRRKLTFGFVLTAIVTLGALTAYAGIPITILAHPSVGPRYSKWMVPLRGIGTPGTDTSQDKSVDPSNPGKPIPIFESSARAGQGLYGHEGRGSTPMAASSPQSRLESSLKSLAQELR